MAKDLAKIKSSKKTEYWEQSDQRSMRNQENLLIAQRTPRNNCWFWRQNMIKGL